MGKIQVNPFVAIFVILIAVLSCYGAYRGMASLNDEAFYRGFNTGTRVQKMFDDQRQGAEKSKDNTWKEKGIEI